MTTRTERIAVAAIALFIAVSAIAGCWGLLVGGVVFPAEWLIGTPFTAYTVPALILGVVVGGSALVAGLLALLRHPVTPVAAFAAGLIQVGWIAGEVLLVGSEPGIMLTLQMLYLVAGTSLAALGGDLWRHADPPAYPSDA